MVTVTSGFEVLAGEVWRQMVAATLDATTKIHVSLSHAPIGTRRMLTRLVFRVAILPNAVVKIGQQAIVLTDTR